MWSLVRVDMLRKQVVVLTISDEYFETVASVGRRGGGDGSPLVTLFRDDTRIKLFLQLSLQRTLDKRRWKEWSTRRYVNRWSLFRGRYDYKKGRQFLRGSRVTPWVAASRDTNRSDAIVFKARTTWQLRMHSNSRPPEPRHRFSVLLTTPCQVWSRWSYPLPYYNGLLLIYYLTLWLWPLTLNTCSVSSVTWRNSVPNFNAIEQSAAELLRFQYLTFWPWTLCCVSLGSVIIFTNFDHRQLIGAWIIEFLC